MSPRLSVEVFGTTVDHCVSPVMIVGLTQRRMYPLTKSVCVRNAALVLVTTYLDFRALAAVRASSQGLFQFVLRARPVLMFLTRRGDDDMIAAKGTTSIRSLNSSHKRSIVENAE
jgi:hypothetical protein